MPLRLFFCLIFSWLAYAQTPVAVYDMATVSGSTLTDISGNGNNGTLHGMPAATGGRSCNGSSDWASIPALVGNSDFTVMVEAFSTSTASNALWGENQALQLSSWTSSAIRNPGVGGGFPTLGNNPATLNDGWHVFYLQRSGTSGTVGVLDTGQANTAALGSITITTTSGSICARDDVAQDLFWSGTIGYVWIYKSVLSTTQMAAIVNPLQPTLTARGIWAPSVYPALSSGPTWQRIGQVIGPTLAGEGNGPNEPKPILRSTGCQILASPCIGLFYSGYTANTFYGEAPLAGYPVSKLSSPSPILATCQRNSVLQKAAGGFLLYAECNHDINVYTSTDGVNLVLAGTAIVARGTAGQWDSNSIDNTWAQEIDASHYLLVYEGSGNVGSSQNFSCGTATSPDGINSWTKNPLNPITGITGTTTYNGCSGPDVHIVNGVCYMWMQDSGSDIYLRRTVGSDCNTYYQTWPRTPVFARGTTAEAFQVADPGLVEPNGPGTAPVLLYYSANRVASPTPSSPNGIYLAIYSGTLAQLVATSEGAFIPSAQTSGAVQFSGGVQIQ